MSLGKKKILHQGAASTSSVVDIFGDSSGKALYELEGNADDTGGLYDGTDTGVTYTTGYIGQGATLSNVKITTPLTTNFSNFSVSCFVKLNAYPSGGADTTFVFKGFYVSPSNNEFLHLRYEGSTSQFRFASRKNATNIQAFSTTSVSLDTWYHLIGTQDSSGNIQIYVDGVAGTGASGAPTFTNTNGYEFGGTANCNIIIDQIRIFNKEVSSSEATTLSNET